MPTLRNADPRQLTALVAVVETGTFTAAADQLGFTQSAVSQQIRQLERAAGVALFDRPRGPRAAELTAAGRMVLEHARSMLARIDRMDEQLDLLRRGLAGRLVVGTFQSASAELVPNMLARMRDDTPDVDVRLFETDDLDELVGSVLTDETDLAFTVDIPNDPRLMIEVLGHDPFVVLAPLGAASGPTVRTDDLRGQPLIGQPGVETVQRMVDERLQQAGIVADYAFRFRNNAAVQTMVRTGMGWAVMPSLAVDHDDPDIGIHHLQPPLPPRAIQLIRKRGRTLPPAADQFRAIAAEVARELLAR
jgi:DNA-binding transcriptional LysR family regulator